MSATDFFLYFPTRAAARAAASDCFEDGLSVTVRLGADDVNWLTQVRADVPREGLDGAERRFDELAVLHGGEYDGFERDVE